MSTSPPDWGPPEGYGPSPPQPGARRSGLATTAMVLGILGLFFVAVLPILLVVLNPFILLLGGLRPIVFIGLVLAALALLFGVLALSRADDGRAANQGAAVSGIVMGAIGVLAAWPNAF